MSEKLRLEDFDILGIITLKDINGIEKYVTELPPDKEGDGARYLSRSKEYYNVKSMSELAIERDELGTLVTNDLSKRNFVIIENMLNCSARVYFAKFEEYIRSGKTEKARLQLEQAEKCLMEDTKNILAILEGKGDIEVDLNNRLPSGIENCALRAIEMDNKAALYVFAKALKNKKGPDEIEVVTPGYGSVYIGPFLKAMYGYNFTNIFKSKYIEEVAHLSRDEFSMKTLMSSERPYEPGKTVFLLDDNIGTGSTMNELKEKLSNEGVSKILSGAIQYNWRNYYRVATGEKEDIDRFEINDFDFVTPINYAGHKLYKRAIASLMSSGRSYDEYLKSKNYRLEHGECDLEGAMYRGIYCAGEAGVKLGDKVDVPKRIRVQKKEMLPEYSTKENKITNPITIRTINEVIRIIEKLKQQDCQDNDENLNRKNLYTIDFDNEEKDYYDYKDDGELEI